MNFGWETEEEKILRYMKIPALKKMEWLYKMQQFILSTASKRKRLIIRKLHDSR